MEAAVCTLVSFICPQKLGGWWNRILPWMHFTQKNSNTGDWQASPEERQMTCQMTEDKLSVSGAGRHFPHRAIPEYKENPLAGANWDRHQPPKSYAWCVLACVTLTADFREWHTGSWVQVPAMLLKTNNLTLQAFGPQMWARIISVLEDILWGLNEEMACLDGMLVHSKCSIRQS